MQFNLEELSNPTSSSDKHWSNTFVSIISTEDGIAIDSNDEQHWNAFFFISFNMLLLPNITFFSDVHFEKALSPINSTLFGIFTSVNFEQFSRQKSGIILACLSKIRLIIS